MRIFTLASLVVAPLVVGLVAATPSLARASSAGAAPRVAKRAPANAAAPRVLPAPLPKPDVLPPLPPVARDVTSITSLTSASIGDATSGAIEASVTASATAASAAAPEALPPLPAAGPSPVGSGVPSAARDVAAVKPSTAPREVKPSGWVFQLGSGALVPASTFIRGLRPLGPGATFELRLGYYATPHVGILTGVRGSYGHELIGCRGGCDAGYSAQVPLMLQLAETDRTRGLYGEVGVAFATMYTGRADGGALYTFTAPVEAKLGAGYRFAGAHGARPRTTADLNVGADIGSIGSAEVKTTSGKVVTDNGSEPTHVVVALSLLLHFSL